MEQTINDMPVEDVVEWARKTLVDLSQGVTIDTASSDEFFSHQSTKAERLGNAAMMLRRIKAACDTYLERIEREPK